MTPPAIVFTDWDGTVTLEDSNDYLTENLGFGKPKRLQINDAILNESLSFKDGFKIMLESIKTPFPDCIDYLLKNIKLDPGFKSFYQWCSNNGIPIIIISSGMKPIIHALLTKLVGVEATANIEIISNDVEINPTTQEWDIIYKHPQSPFGHDKSLSIKDYLNKHNISTTPNTTKFNGNDNDNPILFYCGDGVSDLSAAKETNLLFAKHGKDLITYCKREFIPYTEFNNFNDIFEKVVEIVDKNGENIKKFNVNCERSE